MSARDAEYSQRFGLPATGNTVSETVLLLAIDDMLLPWRKNLCLYLSKPTIRPEPVLVPSRGNRNAPDYYASHFYGTVLFDEGKFRMWYYAVAPGASPDGFNLGPVCYAESQDGIQWVKPNLGQVEYKGSRDNNAIALPDEVTEGVTLIKDEDDPNPQRRYKMVYNALAPKTSFTIRTATSPDGLHWTAGDGYPFESFIEQASFYKFNGLYLVNGQVASPWVRSEGGANRGRQGYVAASSDFDTWLQESAESFLLPEPAAPEERGIPKPYEQVHLGTGAATFGNILVGFYCVWHNRPTSDDWFGHARTSGDLVLVISNDGIHFREPVKGHVYLAGTDSLVTPVPGKSYPTILCQSNGILNVRDETRIYHGRWRNAGPGEDYYAETALATLPRDRWGALGLFPDSAEGSVWSAPIVLPDGGFEVLLNADGANGMRVEISDENFRLLPEFSGENSGHTGLAGGLDCPISWTQGNLASLAGQTIRLRVHLRQNDATPRLYAIYLRAS